MRVIVAEASCLPACFVFPLSAGRFHLPANPAHHPVTRFFSLYFDTRFFVRRAGVACKARRQDASATFVDPFRRSSTDYASS